MAKTNYDNQTVQELEHNLGEMRAKQVRLSFDLENKKLKDVSQIKKTKKEIARILTALKNNSK